MDGHLTMATPDFQTIMLPLLRFAADGREHAVADAREALASTMNLSSNDLTVRLPSGTQTVWANRVAWAKVHLERAGLLHSTKRGVFQITERGLGVLKAPPERVTLRFLSQYPEFVEFRSKKREVTADDDVSADDERGTPEERLEKAYVEIRQDLAADLLDRVKRSTPRFFEELVVELLLAMGYGGSRKEAGAAIGRSGDEGIDGVISEDKLGLDFIYIQAKRWDGSVGRPEIQKFVGALHGKRAKKGVFITTGTFTTDARDYVERIDPKVVLIDGSQLAEHMINFGVAVTTKVTYEVKRIDSDYFLESE